MKWFAELLIALMTVLPDGALTQYNLSKSDLKRLEVIIQSERYLGVKYRAKVDNTIFDCSGYVKYLMSDVGVNVTRSSVSQAHDGKKVSDVKNARPGDILVFKGRNVHNNRPGHVGIVHHWSNDTLYFIHSSVSKGVTIDHLYQPYFAKRFIQVRDVIGDEQ